MSSSNQDTSTSVDVYDEKHCVEMMKLLNADRKKLKNFCDRTLQAEEKEYPVHKCIVGLVSELLNTMFRNEIREKYEKVLKISSMTDVVLGNILDFIYSGFVRMTSDNVFDLLEGAEYMQVDGLKSNCKSYLVKSTNVENCLKYRAYGQQHKLDEVCDASDRVIAEKFADVVQHEDFNELDSDAVSSLINARKERIHEEVVFSSIVRWVNHNADQRQEFFVKLFSFVDLGALSQTFLDKHVLSEPLILSSMQCLQRLLDPSGPLKVVAKSSDGSEKEREIIKRNGCAAKSTDLDVNADKFVVIGGQRSEKSCVTYGCKGKYPLQLPELNEKRCCAVVVKIKHRLYIAGGSDEHDTSPDQQSAEMLDLQDPREWMKISDMLERRKWAASTVSNSRMIVTGGWDGNDYLAKCEIYNCEGNDWLEMKPMLQARGYHGMTSLNGLIYCVGGYDGTNLLSSVECYDEDTKEWKEIAPISKARSGLALVALNGFMYAIGGSDKSSDLKIVERYCPETDTWTKRGNLNVARFMFGACVMNGKLYVVGGKPKKKSVEVYDETEDRWKTCFSMDLPAFGSAVVAM